MSLRVDAFTSLYVNSTPEIVLTASMSASRSLRLLITVHQIVGPNTLTDSPSLFAPEPEQARRFRRPVATSGVRCRRPGVARDPAQSARSQWFPARASPGGRLEPGRPQSPRDEALRRHCQSDRHLRQGGFARWSAEMDGCRLCRRGNANARYYKFNDVRTMKAHAVFLHKVPFRFGRYHQRTMRLCIAVP